MINAENKERNISKKSMIIRLIILIFYTGFLIYFYFLLINIGTNHLISFLILFFAFILILGPLLSVTKNSSSSQLKTKKFRRGYRKEIGIESREFKERKIKPVNLNFKYRKPMIRKCDKCGMIVPNFVNRCPECGNIIKD
jgi:hypothetical protein